MPDASLYVAMCLGASPAVRDSATPIVLHKSTSCSPSQRANVQRQDDMAICSHPSVSPFQRDSPSLQLWCDWGLLSQQRACLSGLIPDILTLYQHNWGSCQVGHWITFHRCVRPDWSTASRAYWPKCGLYSWETQALSLPCHISNCRAEKKGRVSQIHHVPYTQAVLTLARKKKCSLQWDKLQLRLNNNLDTSNLIMTHYQHRRCRWTQLGVVCHNSHRALEQANQLFGGTLN